MIIRKLRKDSLILVVTILTLLVLFLNASRQLDRDYLWYDDAGQFFISQGLNHDSPPNSERQGLRQVIENNRDYNFDPGGFSVLLHFWSGISTNYLWLRVLSFVFFIGSVGSLLILGSYWKWPVVKTVCLSLVLFLSPFFIEVSTSIRAYSLEGFGTLLIILCIEHLKKNPSNWCFVAWSILLAVLSTSRYSFILVSGIAIGFLFLLWFIGDRKKCVQKLFLICSIYMPTLILIFYLSLQFQNASLKQLNYLPYLSNNLRPIIYIDNLVFVVGNLMLLLPYLFIQKLQFLRKYSTLFLFVVVVNFVFGLISILGYHPWDPYSIRCISMSILSLVCFGIVFVEFISKNFRSRASLVFISILIMGSVTGLFIDNNRPSLDEINAVSILDDLYLEKVDSVFIDFTESPSVRYAYEYGSLKESNGIYPNRFRFNRSPKHNKMLFRGNTEVKPREYLETINFSKFDLLISPVVEKHLSVQRWEKVKGASNFWVNKESASKLIPDIN